MPYALLAETTTSPGAIEQIITGAKSAIEFSGECLTAMVGNPVYLFILGAGFVGIGLGLVRKLRGTAKG